jgi:hypothetical protein
MTTENGDPPMLTTCSLLSATKIARNKTAFLQLVQLYVARGGHYYHISGLIAPAKMPTFAAKMIDRFPALVSSARSRAYARQRGRASLHFLAYAHRDGKLFWVVVSTVGTGGLCDPQAAVGEAPKDATRRDGKIEFEDYELVYAHKLFRDSDKKTRSTSTWTWRLREPIYSEIVAALEHETAHYNARGVVGVLAAQRRRPLFSGTRKQVVALHKKAGELWGRVHPQWQARHGGAGWPLPDWRHLGLPVMPRLKCYDDPPQTLADLVKRNA